MSTQCPQQEVPTTGDDLPADVLRECLSYLTHEDAATAAVVSRQWRDIICELGYPATTGYRHPRKMHESPVAWPSACKCSASLCLQLNHTGATEPLQHFSRTWADHILQAARSCLAQPPLTLSRSVVDFSSYFSSVSHEQIRLAEALACTDSCIGLFNFQAGLLKAWLPMASPLSLVREMLQVIMAHGLHVLQGA